MMMMMTNDLIEHELRQRLHKAEKVLRELERTYKGDTIYYTDQIAYVNALRERIVNLP